MAWSNMRETQISNEAKELEVVFSTLKEQMEAIESYNARINKALDLEFKEILVNNRDRKIEDFVESLRYLEKKMPIFKEKMNSDFKREEVDDKLNGYGIGIGDLK